MARRQTARRPSGRAARPAPTSRAPGPPAPPMNGWPQERAPPGNLLCAGARPGPLGHCFALVDHGADECVFRGCVLGWPARAGARPCHLQPLAAPRGAKQAHSARADPRPTPTHHVTGGRSRTIQRQKLPTVSSTRFFFSQCGLGDGGRLRRLGQGEIGQDGLSNCAGALALWVWHRWAALGGFLPTSG